MRTTAVVLIISLMRAELSAGGHCSAFSQGVRAQAFKSKAQGVKDKLESHKDEKRNFNGEKIQSRVLCISYEPAFIVSVTPEFEKINNANVTSVRLTTGTDVH